MSSEWVVMINKNNICLDIVNSSPYDFLYTFLDFAVSNQEPEYVQFFLLPCKMKWVISSQEDFTLI